MAQKREKEETELKVPETVTLCTPPISSKLTGGDDQTHPRSPDLKATGSVDHRSSSARSPDLDESKQQQQKQQQAVRSAIEEEKESRMKRREVKRCSGCKRKVGLMGFRCRCGDIFCSEHRYSDRHDCSYDYKAAGREAIARENPLVRAAKILKV